MSIQPTSDSPHASMMGSTMGVMMKHHLSNVTLGDLLKAEMSGGMQSNMQDSMSEHHEKNILMGKIHFAVTATIVALIPFIIAGLAFLLVLWM